MAGALVSALRDRGVVVHWDGDLKEQNVVSQAAWMAQMIAENLVIPVLSEAFVEHFGRITESPAHRGVRFESSLIIQKYYDHWRSTHCPIIPVADRGFVVESAPAVLAGIPISRLGEQPGDGIDEIVRRIRRLEGAAPSQLPPPLEPHDIVSDMEWAGSTAVSGPDLVREWLRCLVGTPLDAGKFAGTFSAVENVIRGSVDDRLMQEITDRCVVVLNTAPAGSPASGEKARALIVGLAWLLRRRGEFGLAARVVLEAVDIAETEGDLLTAALGHASLGHIRRELAEGSAGRSRSGHLRTAEGSARKAIKLLRRLGDSTGRIGACEHVHAHVRWCRHQLLGEARSLRAAARLAEKAARHMSEAGMPIHQELCLLRAEIAAARGDAQRAGELVERVVRSLTDRPADSTAFSALVGRAHLVSAEIRRHTEPLKAVRLAEAAFKIFDRASMTRFADLSRWMLVTLDPRAAGVTPADVRYLERRCQDPRVRLGAVAERGRRIDERIRPRWSARAEWRDILKAVESSAGDQSSPTARITPFLGG
ncbi:hypothetical protein [Amycolatopsis azurea]|uniref:Uncharacterized protein n=1 Tax=Amycolatopsis azurea DSM 43854 TaxID=1238180 RepID=M2NN90_9PSEU|nr:hypothetical protein [Amycolatopsis azurea]EMD23639.1 hypothetical protein C791_7029 [Amycolatopsis azurea DSM 43854]OOC01093.1 hypothetical protein B0293_39440 [Amycolatopsis azurea DSM 43854]